MKRGTPEHPKFLDLCARLNLQRYEAAGILEMLWHFTAKFTPQGNIGKYSDKAIAEAIGWRKRSGSAGVASEVHLRSALVASGFLDSCPQHRLVVHDWANHADQAVTKMLDRRGLSMIGTPDSLPEPGPVNKPEPEPEPVLPAADAASEMGALVLVPFISESDLIDATAARLCARHPKLRSCGPREAAKYLRAIVSKLPKSERAGKLQAIDANHQGWCESEYWKKDGGEYAKGLANWLAPTMARFDQTAPIRAPDATTGSKSTDAVLELAKRNFERTGRLFG